MAKKKKEVHFLRSVCYFSVLSALFFVPFSKAAIEISLGAGLTSGLILILFARPANFWYSAARTPLLVTYLLYIFLVEISAIHSFYPSWSEQGLLRVIKYFLLYLLVVNSISDKEDLRQVFRVIWISTFLSCLNGLYQVKTGWDFFHQHPILIVGGIERVTGSFNHPNNLAAYLVTVIIMALFIQETRVWEAIKAIFICFYIFVLFQTSSRMPVILLGFVLLISFFVTKNKLTEHLSLFYFIGLLSVCILYFVIHPPYFFHFFQIMFGDLRTVYWQNSIDLIKHHYIFGWGINTGMQALGNHAGMQRYGATRFVYPHNFVLQAAIEIGLTGLAAFLILLGQFFWKAVSFLRHFRDEAMKKTIFGCVMALVFILLHSLVDNNLQSLQLQTFFWILIGLVMSISYRYQSGADKARQ